MALFGSTWLEQQNGAASLVHQDFDAAFFTNKTGEKHEILLRDLYKTHG